MTPSTPDPIDPADPIDLANPMDPVEPIEPVDLRVPVIPAIKIFSRQSIPWWIRWFLGGIRKLETLRAVQEHARHLTPYEMQALLAPEDLGVAVEERLSHIARFIETLRNMAILAPIVITWLSLSGASDAYEQSLLKDKSLATVPFLQLWQAGFPLVNTVTVGPWHYDIVRGHTHWFTFGNFAFLAATILGILLILTFVGQFLALGAYWLGKAVYRWMNGELYQLCRDSELWALGPGVERKEPEIREMLGVLEKIGDAAQEQSISVRKIEEDITEIHHAATKVGVAAQQVKETFDPYGEITRAMEHHARDLITHHQMTEAQWHALLQIMSHAASTSDAETQRIIRDYEKMRQMGGASPMRRKPKWWRRLNPFRRK